MVHINMYSISLDCHSLHTDIYAVDIDIIKMTWKGSFINGQLSFYRKQYSRFVHLLFPNE